MTQAPLDRTPTEVEGVVQLGLTLAVGVVAAAASWSHVLDLAARHGQGGWLAWAVAACIETSAVSAGLEVRRRRRQRQNYGLPVLVLVSATALQLAAQVAQAERSGWGVILAAVPAVTFLVLVKLTLGRAASAADAPAAVATTVEVQPRAVRRPAVVALAEPAALTPSEPTDAVVSGPKETPDVDDLLLLGRAVADDLRRQDLPLNRRNLLTGIRARGRSCSTERAGALLKALRDTDLDSGADGQLDETAV